MNKIRVRSLAIAALLLVFTTGCASVPKPEQQTETRLVDANSALDAVNEQSTAFYTQLGATIQKVKEFCTQLGWSEFEQILLEYPSLRDPDNDSELTPDIESRLAEWGRRWKVSWEDRLIGYLKLVDHCTVLEAKRLAVRERMLAVQAKFLAAVMLESYAGRDKKARDIYTVVEMLDNAGVELNSYQPDDLGLFRAASANR
ncbi:MAG: hypothetical protein AB9866_08675 [Syntrophobacteraceae bacterium]